MGIVMTAQQRMLLGSLQEDIEASAGRVTTILKKLQTNTKPTSYSLAALGAEGRELGDLAINLTYWSGVLSGQEMAKDG